MYTIWGVIMALTGFLIVLVSYQGETWREEAEAVEMNPDNQGRR